MSKRKYKRELSGDAAKVERFFIEQDKKTRRILKEKRKINREKAVVTFMAVLGLFVLFGFGMYFLYKFPVSQNPFLNLVPKAIYLFIMLPIFGWIAVLISRHIYGD